MSGTSHVCLLVWSAARYVDSCVVLRQLVISISSWRPQFNLRPAHVWFVVDKVEMGQVILPHRY